MSFSFVYVLGDSLSDTGAFTLTTFGLTQDPALTFPPPSLGYQGRFSDGPVAAEVLAELTGAEIAEDAIALVPEAPAADLAAATLGILRPESSFAYGSARAVGTRTLADAAAGTGLEAELAADPLLLAAAQSFDINLGAQADRLAATLAGGAPENALATIFIGLNDFQDFAPSNPFFAPFEGLALVGDILEATEDAARAAAGLGIGTVALFTLPSPEVFPPAPGVPVDESALALLDVLTGVHALGLGAMAAELRGEGVDARVVDLRSMAAAVDADPGGYGLVTLDVVSVFGTGALGAPNPAAAAFEPDELGFFDNIHFSGALHGVFGAFAARTLSSETRFLGDGGNLRIYGSDDHLVFGEGGDDLLFGGGGGDALFGGTGEDGLFGGASHDLLAGGGGDDLLRGGTGGDVLAGGAGDDAARGNGGADLLLTTEGADLAHGGGGDDVVAIDLSGDVAGARLRGGRGADALVVIGADAAFGGDLEAALAAAGVSVSGFEVLADGFGGALAEGDARWARLQEAAFWGLFDAAGAVAPPLG
ncbi:MAG: SGNH/GDSL hydrolase family protein [Pseudomonadota bacterium]